MKKLLALVLLLSVIFAEFQLQNLEVGITLNEDGSARVNEKMNLIMFGDYSMRLYESGLNKNTLSAWQDLSNISEIRTHVSAQRASITDIVIRPQPLERSGSGLDIWYGQIIIDYNALPYYDKQGFLVENTGMVRMEKFKPRTTRYTFNENALNFQRTDSGNINLDSEYTLSITPPPSAVIEYVNPITQSMQNVTFPTQSRALSWKGLSLVQFSIVYEVEQSLDKEVTEFFSNLQESMRSSLLSKEGLAAIVLVGIIFFSYIYLRMSRR